MAEITTIQPIKKPCRKIRCGAYCRVSTGSAEQLHSYAAQRVWFSNLLNGSQTEVLVDIYADVGISGTTAERPEFMRMLDDCRRGRIDRILTKSISRFARNTRDCLAILRELREMDVTVFFEKENIDTARSADEMMIAIMGGLAQEESQSISRNIRWSLHRKMAAGTLGVARVPYGYDKVNGRLVINDEQAAVVRRIFSLYLSGSGARRIAALFNSEGLPAPESAAWNNITIYKMLSQEMYLGDIRWQKTVSVFMGTSCPNTGQADSFYVSGSHAPIVDRTTFEAVQALRLKNARPAGKTNSSPFRQNIVCGICGRTYYLIGAARPYWQCTGRFDLVNPCTNNILHDEALSDLWRVIWVKLTNHADDVLLPFIGQLERIAEKVFENAESGRLDEILKQKLTLRKMCAEGLISYGEVIANETELNAEYAMLTEKRRKRAEHNALLINEVRMLYKAVSIRNDFGTEILKAVRLAHATADFELLGGIHITMSIPVHEKRAVTAHEPISAIRSLALCGGCGGRLSRRKSEGVYQWKCSNRYCSYLRIKHTNEEILTRVKGVFTRVFSDPRLISLKCQATEFRPTASVIKMQESLKKLIDSADNAEMLVKAAVHLVEEKLRCIEYNVKTEQTAQARCDSPSLHEEVLHNAIVRAINAQILDSSGFDRQSEISADILIAESTELERRISAVSAKLEEIGSERNVLLADISAVPADVLGNKLKLLHTEEQELRTELDELNRKHDSGRHDMYRLKAARELTHGIEALGEFDNDLVRQLVEEITVKSADRVVVRFCGGEKVMVRV